MEDHLVDIAIESYSKAIVLKTFLEANGIECFLKNTNMIQGAVAEGVKVQIAEHDVAKALKLIGEKHQQAERKIPEAPLRKILVPVDFSLPSQNAARFAVMLAARYNAQIKLLHVFNSPIVDMVPFTDVATIQIDFDLNYHALYRIARERLQKFYADLRLFAAEMGVSNVTIGYMLREGTAAYGIIEISKRYKPGIIVMGTKGEGYRTTELVGSVATEVSDQTHLPLLVIPEKAVLKGVDEVKRVLYATNFDERDYRSIRKLVRILAPFSIELHCVHVTDNPSNPSVNALMDRLKEYLKHVKPQLTVNCQILEGNDIASTFMRYVDTRSIHLLALTSVKQGMLYNLFNPSLSKRMLYQSDIPVLLFHD